MPAGRMVVGKTKGKHPLESRKMYIVHVYSLRLLSNAVEIRKPASDGVRRTSPEEAKTEHRQRVMSAGC